MSASWNGFLRRLHRPEPEAVSGERRVIVGLGNPGRAYQGTRHNVGFEVIDKVAAGLDVAVRKKKFGACLGEAQVDEKPLLLVKPQEYMNCSGRAVATILGFYRVGPDRLLVITDDAALEVGRIRLRPGGSAGGHNGLADIIDKLHSQAFARLRIGIGSPGDRDLADYVLSRPPERERRILERATETACQAVLCWIAEGVQTAMNRFNGTEADASAQDFCGRVPDPKRTKNGNNQ